MYKSKIMMYIMLVFSVIWYDFEVTLLKSESHTYLMLIKPYKTQSGP